MVEKNTEHNQTKRRGCSLKPVASTKTRENNYSPCRIKIFEYVTELPFIGMDFHLEFYKNQQTGGSGNVT